MGIHWLVAIDNSSDSELALLNTIRTMNKESDSLYVLHIVEPVAKKFSWFTSDKLEDTQKQMEMRGKEMIDSIVAKTKEFGVKHCIGLVMLGSHVGETICEAINEHNIKILAMGRRGISFVKRIVLGSNSKYCLENANCDVMIAKKEVGTPLDKNLEIELSNLIIKPKETKEESSVKVYQVVRGQQVSSETAPTKPCKVDTAVLTLHFLVLFFLHLKLSSR